MGSKSLEAEDLVALALVSEEEKGTIFSLINQGASIADLIRFMDVVGTTPFVMAVRKAATASTTGRVFFTGDGFVPEHPPMWVLYDEADGCVVVGAFRSRGALDEYASVTPGTYTFSEVRVIG